MNMLGSLIDGDDDYWLHVVAAVAVVVVVVAAAVAAAAVVVVVVLQPALLPEPQLLALALGPFVEHVDAELPLPLLEQLQLAQMDDQMDQRDSLHCHDVDRAHQKQRQLLMLPVKRMDLD